jgi:hypothetical protein
MLHLARPVVGREEGRQNRVELEDGVIGRLGEERLKLSPSVGDELVAEAACAAHRADIVSREKSVHAG